MENSNLAESLKKLEAISDWFDNQEEVDVEKGLEKAYLSAAEGAEGTQTLQAAFGRSRWLGERTIGFSDPGAVFISLFFQSIWKNYQIRKG